MADDKAQLEGFLGKVDEIEKLIKGLSSADEECVQKADDYLAKLEPKKKFPATDNTGVNRTLINADAFKDPSLPNPTDDFMKTVEIDAKERGERRKQNEKEATAIKEIANESFKRGEYDAALSMYSQAIDLVRDMSVLYTNRAQTLIKLERYEEALTDCDWALRAFSNSLKAYIHRGRAYLALKKYDEAEESFKKGIEIDPTKVNLINGYIRDVHLARQTAHQEEAANRLFESGDPGAQGVVEVLQRISREGQLPVYYAGGLRLLCPLLSSNESDQTLFRTHGGLKLIKSHPLISKCMTADPMKLSHEEVDLCLAYFEALQAALLNNEENQVQLMSMAEFPLQLLRFLELDQKAELKVEVVRLLLIMSQTPSGRSNMLTSMNLTKFLNVIFALMKSKSKMAADAGSVMNNMAIDPKFRKQLRMSIKDGVLPAFEELMSEENVQQVVLSMSISTMTNLCADPIIRRQLANRKACWEACTKTLQKHHIRLSDDLSKEIVHSVLGFIMNMTYETCAPNTSISLICEIILRIMRSQSLLDRCLSCLGHLLPHSQEAVDLCVTQDLVTDLLTHVQDDSLVKACVKSLVACTQRSQSAVRAVCAHSNAVSLLTGLLRHLDDGIVGNAALCLSHAAVISSVSASLVGSDIIKQLLILARDQNRTAVRQNCAILTAKLCQGHTSHLERLRELHGIEILHDVIKHEKS